MARTIPILFLAGALLLPAGLSSQTVPSDGASASSAEIEAVVFQRALEEIASRHRNRFSVSELWAKAIDGLGQADVDSTAFRLTPEELGAFSAVRDADARDRPELFAQAVERLTQDRPDDLDATDVWERALDGLMGSLNDPYASVFTPDEVEDFVEENTGNYTGIGIQITQLNERVTVTAVFRGTPAEQAGLLVGDIIVGVNDENTLEWTTAEVSVVVRGPVGTQVRVVVDREGSSTSIPFLMTRDEVHVPAVQSTMLPDGIGYVSVDRVARSSAREVDSTLYIVGGAKGLILDLRRNPGGFLDEALMMADVFLEPGQRLASLRSRDPSRPSGEANESWNARIPARVPETPMVVLVDEFSASAAEIVAGALQDYDRALIVGDRSFGKGVVQTVLPLPFDHRLRITTGTWHTPLGRALHRPRETNGRPLEENLDTFPVIRTPGGRVLYATGGVFPDLEVPDDTLRFAERELLRMAGEAEVPLGVRIQEFAFDQASALRALGENPRLDDEPFQGLLDELVSEGVPEAALADPVAKEYLAWRTRFAIAERMDNLSASMVFRMERDPQLAEAVRLLVATASQGDLFAAAERVSEERKTTSPSGSRNHP